MSVIKTRQLMLRREVIAVCSQIHTKQRHSVQNTQFLNITAGGT